MILEDLVNDLEKQGFECKVLKGTEIGDFAFFGLGLKKGNWPVKLLAKIQEGVIFISTVDLFEDVSKDELKGFMYANDLVRFGKFFLSVDINNDENNQSFTIDYGFEIASEFYTEDMLRTYINNMVKDIENLELEE